MKIGMDRIHKRGKDCTVDMCAAHHHATMQHRRTLFTVRRRREKASTVLAAAANEQEFDCENLYHMVQLPFNEQCDHVTCLTQQILGRPLWPLWPIMITQESCHSNSHKWNLCCEHLADSFTCALLFLKPRVSEIMPDPIGFVAASVAFMAYYNTLDADFVYDDS